MSGKLYLVATPIGNLEDITLRAIQVLKNVNLIAAEDTRHTLKLLNKLEISKPLTSYYKQTEKSKTEVLIEKILRGENIALVSDAGTPAISDPGEEIVKIAINNNIEVISIPGPCAAITALVASGINTESFSFQGFLPYNNKEKRNKLEKLKNYTETLIIYEAPHKLLKTLDTIKEILGDRKIVLARELTKIHEEFLRGRISEILTYYKEPRGEFVILIEGNKEDEDINKILSRLSIEEHFEYYKKLNCDKKEIIKKIAKDRNIPKNEVYMRFLKRK